MLARMSLKHITFFRKNPSQTGTHAQVLVIHHTTLHIIQDVQCWLEWGCSPHWDLCLSPYNYHTQVWHTKHYSPQFPANSITHKISHATVAQGYISRSPNKSTHSIVIIAWDSHSPDISIINKQIIIHTKIKKSISQHLDKNKQSITLTLNKKINNSMHQVNIHVL